MTQEAIELLQKALALPERERAEMAGTLIDSLDPTIDENLEQAWQQEIAKRMTELQSGTVKTIPWDAVRKDAQAILDGKSPL
jgi:putative addiction module component (TIGR02574 family)